MYRYPIHLVHRSHRFTILGRSRCECCFCLCFEAGWTNEMAKSKMYIFLHFHHHYRFEQCQHLQKKRKRKTNDNTEDTVINLVNGISIKCMMIVMHDVKRISEFDKEIFMEINIEHWTSDIEAFLSAERWTSTIEHHFETSIVASFWQFLNKTGDWMNSEQSIVVKTKKKIYRSNGTFNIQPISKNPLHASMPKWSFILLHSLLASLFKFKR